MERSAPSRLITPTGTLYFNNINQVTYPGQDDIYRISEDIGGGDGAELRTPQENRSQTDGPIVHRFFQAAMHLGITGYMKCSSIAARNDAEDALKGALRSIIRTDGRWQTVPSGQDERFLTVRQEVPVVCKQIDGALHSFDFGLVSSREPVWLTLTEVDTTIASGASATIHNEGNAESWPVFEVYGAGTNFTITNTTTSRVVKVTVGTVTPIDGTVTIAAYVEVIPFRGTMYADGTGDDIMPFCDQPNTDFSKFTLLPDNVEPGGNLIALSGDFDHVVVKSNHGWV